MPGSLFAWWLAVPAGADLGLWVIERLDVDENMFMRDGVALEFKGSLSISEYGDDAA